MDYPPARAGERPSRTDASTEQLHGWEQRRRWMYDRVVDEPRLTHEYRDLTIAPAFLIAIADALSDYCGVRYDGIWMNWYRDNRDSTSWHADRPANIPETATIPVLSLGAPRRFLIRPYGGGRSTAFTPLWRRRPHHARPLPTRLAT